ncbi:MAG: GntR family transcriptional regulator [Cyanobacteria bacterium J083]|nr:MAG: GntR family transcriptional regulator [Cyanobacteria bacterium J083]
MQFNIQTDSDIPASKQLFNQIQFAIASGQYPPGHRLPSTRQLAIITGLHRNTISKVYQQLEEIGLVKSQAGSGIYVQSQPTLDKTNHQSPLLAQYPTADKIIQHTIDELLESEGCTLAQIKEIFLAEIDWRLRCSARVILTVPERDIEAGKLMLKEVQESLAFPVELVLLEQIPQILSPKNPATLITSRYFLQEVVASVQSEYARVIPLDIYDYAEEIALIKQLPSQAYLGIVSLSEGTLNIAHSIVQSLRGDDILVVTAQAQDASKLEVVVRTAHTIICDSASEQLVKQAVKKSAAELIRYPDIIPSKNYISSKSLELLKRELSLS